MNETTEKYLSQMLEGYEQNLGPLNAALDALDNQRQGLQDQHDSMVAGIAELKVLLGLEEEQEAPQTEESSEEE